MSFAQEMKDFLSAWQAVSDMGEKKKAGESDRAYKEAMIEIQRGELDLKQQTLDLKRQSEARRAAIGGAGGAKAETPSQERARIRFEWQKEDREKKEALEEANAVADALPGGYDAVDPAFSTAATDPGGDEIDEFFGGEYADGGMVQRNPYEQQQAGQPAALPVAPRPQLGFSPPADRTPKAFPGQQPAPAMAPAVEGRQPALALPNTAPAEKPYPRAGDDIGKAAEPAPSVDEAKMAATKVVLKPAEDAVNQVGEEFITSMAKPAGAVDDGAGYEALSPEEFDTILKTIDPEGKLPEHMRTAAVLGAAFNTVKDPARKYKLARGVLGSAMEQSQILGSLVPEALQNGNVNEACRLFNDACNKFPTGHRVEVTPSKQGFTYVVLDAESNVVMDGKLTPAEFMEASGQVADGSMFLQQVYGFYSENKKTKGDYGTALGNITPLYTAANDALEGYKTIADSDATYEEKKAAYDKFEKAKAALADAEKDAVRLGRSGEKPRPSDQVTKDVRSARRSDAVSSAIPAPVDPNAPPAPKVLTPEEEAQKAKTAAALGRLKDVADQAVANAGPEAPTVDNSPAAPRDPAQREIGKTYVAPNGRLVIWRGNGWQPVE